MNEPEQTTMLTADLAPKVYLCPTCRGNRTMLRRRFPDEPGDGMLECRCRTCEGQGVVTWDPADDSIPY